MPLTELNHYFVRCKDLEQSKQWYCEALGFEVMPRPPFPFPGYWLGVNGRIQVHMGPQEVPNAELYYRGTPRHAAGDNAGIVDHIAFLAENPAEFRERFDRMRAQYWARSLPESDLFQIFVRDPNGLAIELNFFGLKAQGDWGGEDYSEMPTSWAD
jgi:catechol 2,3-dioxygenase-like lactoylglutathione lyase family enzyme